MKDTHHSWSLQIRKAIEQYASELELVDPDNVVDPPPSSAPVEGLALVKGASCNKCTYFAGSEGTMLKHSQEEHGWVKAQGPQWRTAWVQTFFQGNKRRYFEVTVADATSQQRDATGVDMLVAALLQEGEKLDREEAIEETRVEEEQLSVDNTPWMQKTRWAAKFAGRNLRNIAALGQKPREDEPGLQSIWKSVARVFDRCKKSIASWRRHEEDGDLILGWLNSPQKDKFNPKPFSVYYEQATHDKYVAYFQRLVCYHLKLMCAEDTHGHSFTRRDEELLRDLWDAIELGNMEEDALDTRVFNLCVAFWMHENTAQSKSSIVHFSAVLGIDGKKGCYRQPEDYGQILAALLYCSRLLLFEYALPMETREHIVNRYDAFLGIHHLWLVDGRPTPFHVIDNLLAYASGAGKDAGGKPRVQWSADRQTIIHQGQHLHLSQLRSFVTQICDAAEEILYKDLMFLSDASEIRDIDLRGLVDDIADGTVGYSFVTDPRNNLRGGRERMLHRLKASPLWRSLFRTVDDRLEPESKAWHKYQTKHEAFKELKSLIVHILGGGPARGRELLGIRYANAVQNMRNIFVTDGQIMVVTAYHKSQAITGQQKVIPRFLPARAGQFIVAYLAEVLPFVTLVDRRAVPSLLRSFVWTDEKGVWDTTRVTKALTRETSTRLRVRITFQDYRHIAKAIDREHVRGLDGDEDDEQDHIHDLASAHTSNTADNIYGIDASMLHSLSARTINAFRAVSDRWHQFLHLNSRQQWSGKIRARGVSQSAQLPEPKRHRVAVKRDEEKEVQLALERLLGPGATFRSPEQKEALLRIWRGESPLVTILPPSGGKSLLFQLPASVPGAGVTIVVLPFVALMENLKMRCRELGISCRRWTAENQKRAQVVFVIAEAAVGDRFLTFVSDLQVQGRLDRIVIDECHVMLTAADYRRQLPDLDRLRRIPCQFVLLTGTLPPRFEAKLVDAYLLGTEEHGLRYVRAITDRSNVAYSVDACEDGKIETRVCEIVEEARRRFTAGQKGVVFCGDRGACERIAIKLGCQPYHAKWESKERSLESWMDGAEKVMVATSALGTGVDIAGIRLVVHLGRPHGIMDFVQEVGRAGRGGERVESRVVVEKGQIRWLCSEQAKNTDIQKEAMRLFIVSQKCRREELGAIMDRVGRRCEESGGEKCDRCAQESSSSEEAEVGGERDVRENWAEVQRERYGKGVELWQERVRSRGLERARIEQAIGEIGEGCAACWVHGLEERGHGVDGCSVVREAIGGSYRERRRLIKYEANSCCYRCSLPGDWCQWYVQKKRCLSRDVIVPMVFGGLGIGAIREAVCGLADSVKIEGVLGWMGKFCRVGDSKGTNAVRAAGVVVEFVLARQVNNGKLQ
jgi:superfamily II DNA helicase RecQ